MKFIYASFDYDFNFPKYSLECLVSAYSLKRISNSNILVYTNNIYFFEKHLATNNGPIDDIIYKDSEISAKHLKIKAMIESKTPFIYLDTHTVVFDDISKILDTSFDFNIAGVSAPWRENMGDLCVKNEISKIYALNTGVLFFKKNIDYNFFLDWYNEYNSKFAFSKRKTQDQPSFEKISSIYKPKIWNLPNNYNFRANLGGLLSGKCYVWHSHIHIHNEIQNILNSNNIKSDIMNLIKNLSNINNSHKTHVYKPFSQSSLFIDQLKR